MIRLEDILAKVEKHHPGDNLDLIRRAYIFSAKEHKGQVRASGEPYLTHPLEVSNLLAEMKMDATTVSVGLLHDVVEDTLVSLDDVEQMFGPDVAHIVDGVTEAMKLDPNLTMAELYLATAYSQQFIPGSQSPENMKNADLAVKTFEGILEREPNNVSAVAGLAFIYQNTYKFQKAHEYYLKQGQLEPTNPIPFYAVGSVNWIMVSNKADPPPVDEQIRLVDEGLANLDKAISLNPDYDEAMSYKNLLLREKARLTEDETQKAALTAQADQLFDKALDTRKKNQERKNKAAGGIDPTK